MTSLYEKMFKSAVSENKQRRIDQQREAKEKEKRRTLQRDSMRYSKQAVRSIYE